MKHSKRPHLRTLDKINLLIRMELDNPLLSSTQIAELCGLTIQRFSVLKSSPYYSKIHNQYMTGLVTDLDSNIKKRYAESQQTLQFAVPVAMQVLLKQALQTKDERVRNKAANDILDRDGRFAKATRQTLDIHSSNTIAESKDNDAVLELIKALESVKQNTNPTPALADIATLTDTTQ